MEKAETEKRVGFVFFAENLEDRTLERVQAALISSRLPETALRELHPRHLFARATKALVKRGVFDETGTLGILRDKIPETDTHSVYQVSVRLADGNGVQYRREAVLTLDKETLAIRVVPSDLQREIDDAYAAAAGVYSVSDFRALAHRIVASKHREIHVRDGVYFVPPNAAELLDRLRSFFNALGFSLFILPVGTADGTTRGQILKAVVSDIQKNVAALREELETAADVSDAIARNRLETVRRDLLRYREIAEGLGETLQGILIDAGEAGNVLRSIGSNSLDALIQEVRTGENVDPLLIRIVGKREPADFRVETEESEELRLELTGRKSGTLFDLSGSDDCVIKTGP